MWELSPYKLGAQSPSSWEHPLEVRQLEWGSTSTMWVRAQWCIMHVKAALCMRDGGGGACLHLQRHFYLYS